MSDFEEDFVEVDDDRRGGSSGIIGVARKDNSDSDAIFGRRRYDYPETFVESSENITASGKRKRLGKSG